LLAAGLQAQLELGNPNLASFPELGTPGGSSAYGAVAAGDVDGDLNADLAVVAGTDLVFFPSPAVLDDGVWLLDEVRDVCFTTNHNGSGRPAFLATSARGLEAVVFDGAGAYGVQLLSSDPRWVNAHVRAGLERGAGGAATPVLVGLEAGGHEVFQAAWSGATLGAPTTLYTLVNTVLDLQLLDWNGDSNDVQEVALLHAGGLQIRPRTAGAAPLFGRAAPVSDDSIAVLHKASSAYDLLAWTTHVPGDPEQSLLLLCTEFWTVSPGPYLGPYSLSGLEETFVDLAGGDLQGEQKDALILTPESGASLLVLENESVAGSWLSVNGAGPFKPTVPVRLDLEIEDPLQGAISADFFSQRDASGNTVETLAVVQPSLAEVAVYPTQVSWGKENLLPDAQVAFSSAFYLSTRWLAGCNNCSFPGGVPGNWALTLQDEAWGDTPGATKVEMVVRVSFNNATVANTAFHHEFFDIDASSSGSLVDFDTRSLDYFPNRSDCTQDPLSPLPTSFFAMVRPVVVDASGGVTAAWPWAILGVSESCSGYAWLAGQTGSSLVGPCVLGSQCVDQLDCAGDACPSLSGSSYIPSPVPQARIPTAGHILPIIYPAPY
jgi:hypothetical protein